MTRTDANGRTWPGAYRFALHVLRPLIAAVTDRHWSGGENLPTGGFIAVSNHVTNLDFLTFGHYLVNHGVPVKYLAKVELFRVPVVGPVLKGAHLIPVERGTSHAVDALASAQEALARGECVGIFPEGTLTHDPEGWPMRSKTGAARLALTTRAPVIPIAQWGAQRLMPRFSGRLATLRRQRVDVVAMPPVDLADLYDRANDSAAVREAADRIMAALTRGVGEIRGETPPDRPYDRRVDGDHPAFTAYLEKKAARTARRSRAARPGAGTA